MSEEQAEGATIVEPFEARVSGVVHVGETLLGAVEGTAVEGTRVSL